MDQGSTLAGTEELSLARLFLPAGRASCLSPSPPFWLGNGHPDSPRTAPTFPRFSFPTLFPPLFSALLSHLPRACAQRCPSLSLLNPPVSRGCRVLATPSPSPWPAPPQSPLSSLGPFVLTVVCQLGLHFESKSKAVCCEKMEKWRNDWG